MSLLEEAKKITKKTRREVSEEEIELYLAWLKGEVTAAQVARVAYPSSKPNSGAGKVFARSFAVLQEAYRQGKIIINK